MCGIIGTFGGNPIEDGWKLYLNQKSRGAEGFGFVALKGGKVVAFERATHEKSIKVMLDIVKEKQPDALLFHHRYPTSTINVPEAAHPLPISKKGWKHRYYILHNGIVNGGSESEAEREGYRFKSRVSEIKTYQTRKNIYTQVVDSEVNDSEILGYYVASYLEGERKDIPLKGSIAALVLREHKKSGRCTLYAMRNSGNPLLVKRGQGVHTLSVSSESAQGAPLDTDIIHELDWNTLTFKTHAKVDVGSYGFSGLNSYPYQSYQSYQSYKDKDESAVTIPTPPIEQRVQRSEADAPIIRHELQRLARVSLNAHDEYEQAVDAFQGDTDTGVVEYLADLKGKADDAEAEYQEAKEEAELHAFTI